jgi:hypothetical protein
MITNLRDLEKTLVDNKDVEKIIERFKSVDIELFDKEKQLMRDCKNLLELYMTIRDIMHFNLIFGKVFKGNAWDNLGIKIEDKDIFTIFPRGIRSTTSILDECTVNGELTLLTGEQARNMRTIK